MRSSYAQNNYGEVLFSMVTAYKPARIVELGVLDGYSTFHISEGIRKNNYGHLKAYDLFEDYPYKHSRYDDIRLLFEEDDNVSIFKGDAFEVHKDFPSSSVDMLHVDISNNGDIVKRMVENWDEKIVQGGIIVFEGGSQERDKVRWMTEYNKSSIKEELDTNKIIEERYIYGTYLKFPSMTVLLKKR